MLKRIDRAGVEIQFQSDPGSLVGSPRVGITHQSAQAGIPRLPSFSFGITGTQNNMPRLIRGENQYIT